MSFDVIQLEQGTLAWRQWRSFGLGASDAPAFMDENPWKSSKQALQEKLVFDVGDRANEANASWHCIGTLCSGCILPTDRKYSRTDLRTKPGVSVDASELGRH